MKATVIRGVKLRPGSVVYHVRSMEVGRAVRHADPDASVLDEYAPAIVARTIAATNGLSFAFVRSQSRSRIYVQNPRAPWSWVRKPETYCVTLEEAQAELMRVRSELLGVAEKMLPMEEDELAEAQSELAAAQARVERLRESIAALKDGTHPALHYAKSEVMEGSP